MYVVHIGEVLVEQAPTATYTHAWWCMYVYMYTRVYVVHVLDGHHDGGHAHRQCECDDDLDDTLDVHGDLLMVDLVI